MKTEFAEVTWQKKDYKKKMFICNSNTAIQSI